MKFFKKLAAALTVTLSLGAHTAMAEGWPARYEGVMLQGFYWDSYADTKWTNLESQAETLSKSFDLIWVPNSGWSGGHQNMGYTPVYWFTNHNSSFGTEKEIRSMIKTFKEKGVGIIADVVINHRNGRYSWTDFPVEQWNGRTWQIGLDGICCTDEVNRADGQPRATGAADEGQDFDGARDLDHTNANVQDNCKNYCKFLLEDMGYAGFRLDMVKGYAGYYTKMYNTYAKPKFSVGEYYDGEYDALAGWIESTGKESAAFDFAFKRIVTDAFGSGDLRKLVWKANGNEDQPGGLIHFGYQQYAVTFIDNHDTYGGDWKFNGSWADANAYMLSCPGTPCVFLPHWQACGDQIAKMIEARKAAGISNTSTVRVLRSEQNLYLAEIQGSKGTLAIKIGSGSATPAGYSNSDIYCSGAPYGETYVMWVKTNGGSSTDTYPANVYIIGHVNGNGWTPETSIAPTTAANGIYQWKNVTINNANDAENPNKGFFSFTTARVAGWDDGVNMYDRYGAATANEVLTKSATVVKYPAGVNASGALSWAVTPQTTDITLDLTTNTVTLGASSVTPDPTPDMPAKLYILGNLGGQKHWATHLGVEMTRAGNTFIARNVEFEDADDGSAYFTLVTKTGADWDAVNTSDRYGAEAADHPLSAINGEAALVKYPVNVSASGAPSWKITPGTHTVVADFAANKIKLNPTSTSAIETVQTDNATEAVYYNLQGVQVVNPTHGVYIKVADGKVSKVAM